MSKTYLFVKNNSSKDYYLHGTKIPSSGSSVVKIEYSQKKNTKHSLKSDHGNLSFKLNINGLLQDLDKCLEYGTNTNYLPIGRSTGNRNGTIWEELSVIPSFYMERRNLVINC